MTLTDKLLKPLRKVYLIGIAVWIVGFVIISGVMFLFAAIGLHEAEKQAPHAFDQHHFINYNFFHFILNIGPGVLIVSVIILVSFVAAWPQTKSQGGKEE